jgi:UDP-N-acetylmuramate dehydrogenase
MEPTGAVRRLQVEELNYSYRDSRLKANSQAEALVVRAAFRTTRSSTGQIREIVLAHRRQRTTSQPRQLSAGSVFRNPIGDYAGRLIEAAGLKGRTTGGAQISHHHANFIVNLGGARAQDVYCLMRHAQDQVFERFSVWLVPELELFGRWHTEQRAAMRGPRTDRGAP